MHFQVMVDLGPGVDPESGRDIAERTRKLVEPYFAEAPLTPWKLYSDAETEGLVIDDLVEGGFLDRRWDPVVAPKQDPASGLQGLSMAEAEAIRQWWQSIVTGYSHPEVAQALNRCYKSKPRNGTNPADHRGDKAHYADEGGLFVWSGFSPNGKWDSAVVGGRYSPFLPLKVREGGEVRRCDAARKREIDWELMRRERMEMAAQLWLEREGQTAERLAASDSLYRLDPSTMRQEYLEAVGSPITDAFVDAAGAWIGGEVGWGRLGIPEVKYAAAFRAWLQSVPEHHVLTLVDCHL